MENRNLGDASGETWRALGQSVPAGAPGRRVDDFLAETYPFLSRSGWQKRIRSGILRVSGRKVRSSYRLREGDTFAFYHPAGVEPDVDRRIYPLWRQGGVMAIFKPGNLPMHENGPYRKNTLAAIMAEELGPDWAAVHRLDRETSGIVLCGNGPEIRRRLAASLAARTVRKEYLAIVRGTVPDHQREWIERGPIGDLTDSAIRIKKWVVPDGLPSETSFRIEETRGRYSLVRARPLTGRTNQIRIHLAWQGLPLVGDKLYHEDEEVFLEFFARGGNTPEIIRRTGFHRHCLHAAALHFTHPESGKICEIRCPLPDDMQELWRHKKIGAMAASAKLSGGAD